MAIDRWWGIIPALTNQQEMLSFMAEPGYDTYIVEYSFNSSVVNQNSALDLYGHNIGHGHDKVGRIDSYLGINSATPVIRKNILELEEGTICYFKLTGTATSVNSVTILWVKLPKSGKVRTLNDVLAEMTIENTNFHEATMTPGDTTIRTMESMVSTNHVEVPALQATPAVINELEVVSTDTDDDGDPAGTGARTLLVEYWNTLGVLQEGDNGLTITMNGTTPVIVDVSALSIWVINKILVATVGSKGANQGIITLTDLSA